MSSRSDCKQKAWIPRAPHCSASLSCPTSQTADCTQGSCRCMVAHLCALSNGWRTCFNNKWNTGTSRWLFRISTGKVTISSASYPRLTCQWYIQRSRGTWKWVLFAKSLKGTSQRILSPRFSLLSILVAVPSHRCIALKTLGHISCSSDRRSGRSSEIWAWPCWHWRCGEAFKWTSPILLCHKNCFWVFSPNAFCLEVDMKCPWVFKLVWFHNLYLTLISSCD